ncbi:MAG: hypothetical protein A2Y25_07280 [Candidatus Melainabacteria bacterium GWF2_37_15]|nr:MAG: hypothetical protein A2Y25_07280 [Candidatus Melainabacteria bacterium GWF2_37_15]
MLPFITEEIRDEGLKTALEDVVSWRKKMVHYIKEENPEINAAIIEAAEKTQLDPKAIAVGAYIAYIMLEKAEREETGIIEKALE